MSNIAKVRQAQSDVEKLQSALVSVQGGLDTVEMVVETAVEVRRGLRRLVKVGLVLAVVGVAVAIVLKARSSDDASRDSSQPSS